MRHEHHYIPTSFGRKLKLSSICFLKIKEQVTQHIPLEVFLNNIMSDNNWTNSWGRVVVFPNTICEMYMKKSVISFQYEQDIPKLWKTSISSINHHYVKRDLLNNSMYQSPSVPVPSQERFHVIVIHRAQNQSLGTHHIIQFWQYCGWIRSYHLKSCLG